MIIWNMLRLPGVENEPMMYMQVDVSRQQLDDLLVLQFYLYVPIRLTIHEIHGRSITLLKHISTYGSINSSGVTLES